MAQARTLAPGRTFRCLKFEYSNDTSGDACARQGHSSVGVESKFHRWRKTLTTEMAQDTHHRDGARHPPQRWRKTPTTEMAQTSRLCLLLSDKNSSKLITVMESPNSGIHPNIFDSVLFLFHTALPQIIFWKTIFSHPLEGG